MESPCETFASWEWALAEMLADAASDAVWDFENAVQFYVLIASVPSKRWSATDQATVKDTLMRMLGELQYVQRLQHELRVLCDTCAADAAAAANGEQSPAKKEIHQRCSVAIRACLDVLKPFMRCCEKTDDADTEDACDCDVCHSKE